jgi:hypothetical protein
MPTTLVGLVGSSTSRVSDAEAVHAKWMSAGVEGRFMGPHNTPYGLREFVYTDPDGIVLKVGSPR